jgi:hypothetical protein
MTSEREKMLPGVCSCHRTYLVPPTGLRMKTTALSISRQPFPSWSGPITRGPDFIALTKPRVMALAVFTAAGAARRPIPDGKVPRAEVLWFGLAPGSRRGGAYRQAAHRLFVFSISDLFLLFAALLADHYTDRCSTTVATSGGRTDHGPARAERLIYPVRATRDCTRFTVGEA